MEIDIDELTEEELIALNHRVVERLKFLETMHAYSEMMQFSLGEQVTFQPPGRERQIGTLVKYNKKSVTIITESGQKWNVSPHLISKVQEAKHKGKTSGKVVELYNDT
ncbi:MAG: hypothetical protein OEZ68_15250 [Gammaproteobacteria bacterium]|nr:hypothetical protein [Gammaproteobacteria bacterium]MDH5802157.1 hypothetical protein [Gammaproteobacteria bacterium]